MILIRNGSPRLSLRFLDRLQPLRLQRRRLRHRLAGLRELRLTSSKPMRRDLDEIR